MAYRGKLCQQYWMLHHSQERWYSHRRHLIVAFPKSYMKKPITRLTASAVIRAASTRGYIAASRYRDGVAAEERLTSLTKDEVSRPLLVPSHFHRDIRRRSVQIT